MAVKRPYIKTVNQAYDYAIGSANAARKSVCPSQAQVYDVLAAQVTAGAYGSGTLDLYRWNKALDEANAVCTSAPDYNPTTPPGRPPVVDDHGDPKPDDTTDITDITGGKKYVGAGIGAGIPWWVWLAGGAAAYFLLKGKKKGKKRKSRRKKTTRRRRRR